MRIGVVVDFKFRGFGFRWLQIVLAIEVTKENEHQEVLGNHNWDGPFGVTTVGHQPQGNPMRRYH